MPVDDLDDLEDQYDFGTRNKQPTKRQVPPVATVQSIPRSSNVPKPPLAGAGARALINAGGMRDDLDDELED